MIDFKEATPTSGSSIGGREKPKIFEPYKERQSPAAVAETGSFNSNIGLSNKNNSPFLQ